MSSNILPMPRFLYVDPARLYPAAAPTAAPVQRVGPASQAYCVLPWLMMTSGQLGRLPSSVQTVMQASQAVAAMYAEL